MAQLVFLIQWNPVNTVTNGKNLAVLTGDRFNQGFVTRKCMAVLPRGQKKLPYYRGDRKGGGGGATVLIRWIVIYSVDSTIQRSNNQCLQVNDLKHKYAT